MVQPLKILWVTVETKERFLKSAGKGITADRALTNLLNLEAELKRGYELTEFEQKNYLAGVCETPDDLRL